MSQQVKHIQEPCAIKEEPVDLSAIDMILNRRFQAKKQNRKGSIKKYDVQL